MQYSSGETYRYAQGICVHGNELFVAIRNDSSMVKLRKYGINQDGSLKYKSTSGSLPLKHANSMTYCKELGGIVVSTCEKNNETLKLVNVNNYSVKTINIGMDNYGVGYSKSLGLVVGKRDKKRSLYRVKIYDNGKCKVIDNSEIKIGTIGEFEPQGFCVVGNDIYLNQDLVDKKNTNGDLSKHYKYNRILEIHVNSKNWEYSLYNKYKISLDRELEDMSYNTTSKVFYVASNLNFGTRRLEIYKVNGSVLGR